MGRQIDFLPEVAAEVQGFQGKWCITRAALTGDLRMMNFGSLFYSFLSYGGGLRFLGNSLGYSSREHLCGISNMIMN